MKVIRGLLSLIAAAVITFVVVTVLHNQFSEKEVATQQRDSPKGSHVEKAKYHSDSLLQVEVFKIGKKEVKVDSPAEWLKLQDVISRQSKETRKDDRWEWSPSDLYGFQNAEVNFYSEQVSVTLKIMNTDGNVVDKSKETLPFDRHRKQKKAQPDFGSNHLRSVHELEIGEVYKLHRMEPFHKVLKIKPIRYWLVPNDSNYQVALEYLVLDGSEVWNDRHKIGYMTYLGLLPRENGTWNDAAWIERL